MDTLRKRESQNCSAEEASVGPKDASQGTLSVWVLRTSLGARKEYKRKNLDSSASGCPATLQTVSLKFLRQLWMVLG
jgi:hypothetical protein